MSLHALAGHMATKGRGGDSMLVHMTPEEVHSLQAMALKGGGSLTINPDTGLPEANFLKKMLPMIAGFALGPAGFGLMSAGMAGAAVGGITALSTGSLSRGLMAGLGAYGGASLGAGLAGSGAGAAQTSAMAGLTGEQIAQQAAAQGLTEQGVLNQAAATATKDFMAQGVGDKLMQGASAAFNDPKAFIQGMGGPAKAIGATAAAASPLMAADTVETTTPRQDTGYIRQKKFNPYTQQYIDLEPVKASEWGSRRFSDFANGGIVALAAGGTSDQPLYLGLDKGSSAADVAAAYSQFAGGAGGDTAANQREAVAFLQSRGIGDDIITQGYQQFLSPVASAGPAAGSDAYNTMVGNWFNQNPNATAADISSAINTYGLNPQDVFNAMRASGLSNAALYSAFQPDVGIPTTPQGGLAGLTSLINDYVSKANQLDMTGAQKRAGALSAMEKYGYNMNDVVRATGKTVEELFPDAKKPIVPGPITKIPFYSLPDGVSGGGNTVRNPNGTITTTPNIPGRPEGGFTGMGQVRDAYTAGGGSLGQSNLFVPERIEDMYDRYGNTGGSQQAYEFLMGKGAVDIKKPVTKSGDLMLPYSEAVLGMPASTASAPATQKYIFDRRTRQYVLNPAYTEAQEAAKAKSSGAGASSNNSITDGGGGGGDSGAAAAAAASGEGGGMSNSGEGGGAPGEGGWAYGGQIKRMALGGLGALAGGGSASQYNLGGYSDGGRLLRGPGDGVSDSIPATIGDKQPARLADGEFVVPARIVSELGNGSTEAGARKLYAMMDRVQKARGKTTGKKRVAANTRADKYLPA